MRERGTSGPKRQRAQAALRLFVIAACLMQAGLALGAEADVVRAASRGDLEGVRAALAAGGQVGATQNDGSSALLWAAYHADLKMTQLLLEAGADPNVANRYGVTPLLQASRTGDAPIVAALLAAGADVARTHPEGETALMGAARAGSVETVELLLEHGADPNARESFQEQTALMWAADEGHADVVALLLEAGADPNAKSRVSELTDRRNADFPTGGLTALMWAVRNGHEDVVLRLAEGGADLNLTNGDGASATMIAIANDRFDLAAKLVELGADANDGSLYHAVEMRDATTDWFARDGSRLRPDHDNELTALDLIDRLLAAGADPNKQFSGQMHSASMCCDTRMNGTPTYRAAVAADVAALERLLAAGGDPNAAPAGPPGRGGGPGGGGPPGMGGARTPILAAMNGGRGVSQSGGPGNLRQGEPPFREPGNRKPADAVRVLLQAGADPNFAGRDGSTALHQAARAGKLEVVRALIEGGAKLDAQDREGRTPLDLAALPREERPFDPNFPSVRDPDIVPPEQVVALIREAMRAQGLPVTAAATAASSAGATGAPPQATASAE